MPGVLARGARAVSRLARARVALAALLFACVAAAERAGDTAQSLSESEWNAIQRVVSDQLAAFKAGDDEKAFGQASPGIRAQFGDAPTFMSMVRRGYGALTSARYTEFLQGAVIDGRVIQPLRVVGADNSVVVALYTMERHDGRWKIAGCALAPSTVQAI
jgi:hypothetical protein